MLVTPKALGPEPSLTQWCGGAYSHLPRAQARGRQSLRKGCQVTRAEPCG